jgi:endonuclease/exonuclease/phosphatase family metal-dependent hydrolase
MLAWSNRFKATQQQEVRNVGSSNFPAGGNRSPIIAPLEDSETKRDFVVMNNHLTRGKEENRNLQARLLVEWAKSVSKPIIAVGDY